MLEVLQFFGAFLLYFVGPALATALVIGYGLYNPDTGLGKWVYRWWPFDMPTSVKNRLSIETSRVKEELTKVTKHVAKSSQLEAGKPGDLLTILGNQHSIAGTHLLLKLESFDGNLKNKVHIDPRSDQPLPEFPWITLNNGQIIAYLPNKEGGNWQWFMGEEVTDKAHQAPTTYLTEYGKAFAQSNQKARVTFNYPGLGDQEWRCTDILWTDCQTRGENRFGSSTGMTRMSFLLSKNDATSGEFLLFAQVRGGNGNHGLYILRDFNPEVEIEELV